MSRLFIILWFTAPLICLSQYKQRDYVRYAQDAFHQGNFSYAIELYEQALGLDSTSTTLIWEYASALLQYKDYKTAARVLKKLVDQEAYVVYPDLKIKLGQTQKLMGDYNAAQSTFLTALKDFKASKNKALQILTQHELASCEWAIAHQSDTSSYICIDLDDLNTTHTEFAQMILNRELWITTLPVDSSRLDVVYTPHYQAQLVSYNLDSITRNYIKRLKLQNIDVSNPTVSIDGKRIYFSMCDRQNSLSPCKIGVGLIQKGEIYQVDTLGEIINATGSNTTTPMVTEMDGKEVLFFSSNRTGGSGGMDIWMSEIKNGNQYTKPTAIKAINSIGDEICPYFNSRSQNLYFSSNWHDGFGGFDVFKSPYKTSFNQPENIGQPINSPTNDVYYFEYGDSLFVSSNRVGSKTERVETCCSDIFAYLKPPVKTQEVDSTSEKIEQDKNAFVFTEISDSPIILFFHNDEPDPKTTHATTKQTYGATFQNYIALIDEYRTNYSASLAENEQKIAKEEIDSFFLKRVQVGFDRLNTFCHSAFKILENGQSILVDIQGFASPLAQSRYNVYLTQRRIQSFINQLIAYEDSCLAAYIFGTAQNGARLIFHELPNGEFKADQHISDDRKDTRNSVYAVSAAQERKIEIKSARFLDSLDIRSKIYLEHDVQDIGTFVINRPKLTHFNFTNCSKDTLTLKSITGIPGQQDDHSTKTLLPGEQLNLAVKIQLGNSHMNKEFDQPISFEFEGYQTPLTLRVIGMCKE